MQVSKIRNIAIALALILAVVVAPNVRIVVAISQDAIIEDITHDDVGIEGLYEFYNVTYNLDGTGSDVLDSSGAGLGASLESFYEFEGQESFSGRLHTAIGRGVFGPSEGSGAGISSGDTLWTYDQLESKFQPGGSGAGISITNATADELFVYDQKERYATGSHAFQENMDSDTTWYNLNCSTAANAFNISSEYESLNESLTHTADLDIDDFFNNDGENQESKASLGYYNQHTKGESFVVGYEDAEIGVIDDLRSYLALVNNKDFSDIVITNYNLSSAKFSYNMSEHLTGQIRKAVDYHIDQASGAGSAIMLTFFGAPLMSLGTTSSVLGGGSGARFLNGISSTLNRIGTSVKTGFVSFGTRLKQFGTSATNWVGQRIQDTRRTASHAYQTVGGTIKSALSKGSNSLKTAANHLVNVGKGFGTGVKGIVNKAVHCVTSIATKLVKVLTNPIFLIALVAIACVIGYIVLKKTDKI